MRRENYLEMELLIRKEADLKDLENLQPIYVERNVKTCSDRTQRIWPNDHLIKTVGFYQLYLG